jgi:ribosome biogenesis GTPase / thiamine phosphate phosphatase
VLLTELGWNSYFAAMWAEQNDGGWAPARVVSQQRGLWRIAGDFGERWAEPSSKLRVAAEAQGDWPAVGDWIAAELFGEEHAFIHGILPRRGCFARKAPGKRIEEQVIAANIDTAFLVVSLDGDFSPRRLERYLAQCWESEVKPVIVLNKADECSDAAGLVADAERVAASAPVLSVSARTGRGMDELDRFLAPGQTIVLLGSSGVGKSTLVNRLLRQDVQAVQPTRETDGKGRHTTTSRQLLRLPSGALIIDTPGLREIALWDAETGVAQAFADIEEFAANCRFRDCEHENEPGCAVRKALAAGVLDEERVASLKKLEREQEFQRRKVDPAAMHEYKSKVTRLQRGAREKYQQRERDGGKR